MLLLVFHIQEVIIKEDAEVVVVLLLLLVAVMVVEAVMVVGALCAERLHCVTAGSKKKGWGGGESGEQGHSKEREGCVFTDLDTAKHPSTSTTSPSSPATLLHF